MGYPAETTENRASDGLGLGTVRLWILVGIAMGSIAIVTLQPIATLPLAVGIGFFLLLRLQRRKPDRSREKSEELGIVLLLAFPFIPEPRLTRLLAPPRSARMTKCYG